MWQKEHHLYRIVSMRRKTKAPFRRSGNPHLRRLNENQRSDSTRDHASTIVRKYLWLQRWSTKVRPSQRTLEESRTRWSETRRSRNEKKNFVQSPMNQDHIYRACLQADGRTRQDVVIWDNIAVDSDKPNDPWYSRSKGRKSGIMEPNDKPQR